MILFQRSEENLHVLETTRSSVISTSPNRQFSENSADHYYGVEVPTIHEITYHNGSKLLEANSTLVSRPQEFYSPQIPSSTITQMVTSINNDIVNSETILQSQNNIISTTRTLPCPVENNQININKKGGYFGQTQPQSPQKPEISHPVSRLCDTIESTGKIDRFTNLEAKNSEKEARIDDKLVERVIINSDKNNNDAIVSQDAVQRGKGAQENHRCDQCGKTFVTKASLKVLIDWLSITSSAFFFFRFCLIFHVIDIYN